MLNVGKLLVFCFVAAVLWGTSARGAERDWGSTGTDFNNGANWVGGTAPGLGDVAWFKAAESVQPNVSASLSMAGLYFQSTASSGYDITNTNGAALTLTGFAANVSGSETSDATAAAIGANNTSGTNTIDVPLILAPSSGSTSTFVEATGGTLAVNGAISGNGINLTTSGTGTLVLTGQNTYTGGTTLTNPTSTFMTGSLLLGSNSVVGAGGSLTSGPLGTGLVVLNGSTGSTPTSYIDLSSDSTSARTIQNSLSLNGTVNLGDATKNGTLTFNSTDGSHTLATAATVFSNGATLIVNSPVVIADVVSGFSLNMGGSSILTLTAANTYTSGTVINSGTLRLGGVNVIPQGSNNSVTVNGTLDLNTFNLTVRSLAGTGVIDTVAGGTPTLTVASGNLGAFQGVIQNTAGTLSLNVTGNLTLQGHNTYTGPTTISAGGVLGLGSESLNGASLSLSSTITDNGSFEFNTLTGFLRPNTQGIDFSGSPITGIGQVGVSETAILVLNGANTYSGGTTVSDGILKLGSSSIGSITSGPVGTGALTLMDGSTLSSDSTTARAIANATILSGSLKLGDATNNGLLTFSGAGTLTGTTTLTLNSDVTYSGNIGQTGANRGLIKTGTGTLILSGSNTYSGITNIAAGILSVSSIGNSGAASALGTNGTIEMGPNQSNTSGTLKYTGTGETSDKVINFFSQVGGGAVIDQSGTGLLKFTSNTASPFGFGATLTLQGATAGTGEISGVISNAAFGIISVTKNGTDTWTLSGADTYTGATTVNGGSLLVNGSLASASAVSVFNNGTVLGGTGTIGGSVSVSAGAKLEGGNGTIGTTLTLSGALILNDNSIIQLALGSSGTHSALARTGSNTWTFDGNQSFSFLEVGTTTGTYQDIITGLSADPGTESNWTITNPDLTGTFTYDAGNIDLTIAAVPEPGTWFAAALTLAPVALLQRRRFRILNHQSSFASRGRIVTCSRAQSPG